MNHHLDTDTPMTTHGSFLRRWLGSLVAIATGGFGPVLEQVVPAAAPAWVAWVMTYGPPVVLVVGLLGAVVNIVTAVRRERREARRAAAELAARLEASRKAAEVQ